MAKLDFSVAIHIDPAPLSVGSSLPPGQVGQPFTGQLAISGGVPPVSVVVDPASVPAGLSVDASGAVSGSPSAFGDFVIKGTATDSLG